MNELRAAAFGVPFIPIRSLKGSDILKFHPEFKEMISPYTGEKVILVPALSPDVAVIHAQYADEQGNSKIYAPFVSDTLFVDASKKVIITTDKLVSSSELQKLGANIPYFEVTAVVEVPFGAHPTSCYPFYAYDREFISSYMKAAAKGEEAFREEFLKPFVLDVENHSQYLNLVGGKEKQKRLESWQEGPERWKEIYRYE